MEFLLSEDHPFIVGQSDLSEFRNRPVPMDGGAFLFCTAGHAVVSINMKEYDVEVGTEIRVIPDSVFSLIRADADFRLLVFLFDLRLFEEASYRLDISFFRYLKTQPVFRHTERTRAIAKSFFEMVMWVYNDRKNIYRVEIARNYLRNILLNVCDKVRRHDIGYQVEEEGRKKELFHRFIGLVATHFKERRDVAYYADELCISMSYLAAVTRSVVGKTPKFTIDSRIVQEIKILLVYSDLSLQEISDRLNFPDQSYFGRFFKRYAGCSPAAYRKGGVSESGLRLGQEVGERNG